MGDSRFERLECSYMRNGEWVRFSPNSEEPIKISSPWFEGSFLFLLATPGEQPSDKYQSTVFANGKRLVEVQIQGEFKEKVTSTLFVGGELSTERMQMSALTRMVARGAFSFLKSSGGDGLHYSFGDDLQPPHIATPLWSSMPWVTSAPFELGSSSANIEEKSDKARRRADARVGAEMYGDKRFTWILEAGMLISARDWEVKLPALPSLDLHRLWRDAAMDVCVYFLKRGEDLATAPHSKDRKNYLLQLRIKHITTAEMVKKADALFESAKEVKRPRRSLSNARRNEDDQGSSSSTDDDDDDSVDSGTRRRQSDAKPPPAPLVVEERHREDSYSSVTKGALSGLFSPFHSPQHHGLESAAARCIDKGYDLGSAATARCHGRLLACSGSEIHLVTKGDALYLVKRRSASLVSWKTAVRLLRDKGGSSRISPGERRRRRCDATVASLSIVSSYFGKDELRSWLDRSGASTALFHRSSSLKLTFNRRDEEDAIKAGPVIRACSTRTWREEWCVMSRTGLTFFSSGGTTSFHFDLADVIDAKPTVDDSSSSSGRVRRPFSSTISFQVECVERVVCVVVETPRERDAWVAAIHAQRQRRPLLHLLPKEDEELLNKRAALVRAKLAVPGEDWLPKGRYILNSRRLFDTSPPDENPLRLAETMVRLVDDLVEADFDDDDRLERWMRFLDLAGSLRNLREAPKSLAFWANVYHAMLAHAGLMFGSPSKASQWARYFGTLSYECCGDVFSVAELEHCVIRAAMPRPKMLISDVAHLGASMDLLRVAFATSPSLSSPYSFALDAVDVRLVFALNHGSVVDSPDVIPVYDAFDDMKFEKQLDAATKRALATATVDYSTVCLPRICAWHSLKIGDIFQYLPDNVKSHRSLAVGPGTKLAYHPFDFTCRIPTVLEEDRSVKDRGETSRHQEDRPSLAFGRAFLDALNLTPGSLARTLSATNLTKAMTEQPNSAKQDAESDKQQQTDSWPFLTMVEDMLFADE